MLIFAPFCIRRVTTSTNPDCAAIPNGKFPSSSFVSMSNAEYVKKNSQS